MALTPSSMVVLGSLAPEFSLPDTDGALVSLDMSLPAPATLIMFICNHCPYVVHLKAAIAQMARDYRPKGLAIIAINSNDVDQYPQDHPDRMAEDKAAFQYSFPYLFDGTQEVAKAYQAACTPDFFLFGQTMELTYRGQFDGSRPGNDVPVTGQDLRHAIDQTLAGRPVEGPQKPSIGCNIKWKQVG